jgi:hypothetical protein
MQALKGIVICEGPSLGVGRGESVPFPDTAAFDLIPLNEKA